MKTTSLLLISFALALVFTACDKTVTVDDSRRLDNEAAFAKIAADPAYTKIESQSGNGFIMYKEVVDGATEEVPKFTDQVKVLYTGWFKRYWEREDQFTGDDGNVFNNKVIFDSTADRGDIPAVMSMRSVVDGFATALQHMEVGDKWEVWIPWDLGYGESNQGLILSHSTLVFEIELVEIS